MPTYRLRLTALLARATSAGIAPTGYSIGRHAGIPVSSMNAILAGRTPHLAHVARLVVAFDCTFDDLFELDGHRR